MVLQQGFYKPCRFVGHFTRDRVGSVWVLGFILLPLRTCRQLDVEIPCGDPLHSLRRFIASYFDPAVLGGIGNFRLRIEGAKQDTSASGGACKRVCNSQSCLVPLLSMHVFTMTLAPAEQWV